MRRSGIVILLGIAWVLLCFALTLTYLGSRTFLSKAESPAIYRTHHGDWFAYDSKELVNYAAVLQGDTALPICGRQEGWARICFPGQDLYVKADTLKEKIERQSPRPLQFVQVKPEEALLIFSPAAGDAKPAHWIVENGVERTVDIFLTPVSGIMRSMHFPTGLSRKISQVSVERPSESAAVVRLAMNEFLPLETEWIDDFRLRIRFKQPKDKAKIVLDPGHGGSQKGTCLHGFCEKDLALSAARRLAELIPDAEAEVHLTREDDRDVPLEERVRFAAKLDADLFVSLHLDNWPFSTIFDRPPHGLSCYYHNLAAQGAAENICAKLSAAGFRSVFVIRRSLAVLSPMSFRSVLLELLNLGDQEDLRLLQDPQQFDLYLQALAKVITAEARS